MAGFQDLMCTLQLGQLIDRARTKTFALGALMEMVFAIIAGDD